MPHIVLTSASPEARRVGWYAAPVEVTRVLLLSVFRDGSLHGQAELTVYGLRIGRGGENDIVLEDAAKRVSRFHAELRVAADGTVTLSDLQSANGTWVEGQQIDTVALAAGVPFTVGPYRLMIEEQPGNDRVAATSREPHAPGPPPPPLPSPSLVLRDRGDTAKTAGTWNVATARAVAVQHRRAVLVAGVATIALLGAAAAWQMTRRLDIRGVLGPTATSDPSRSEAPPPPPPPPTETDREKHIAEAVKRLAGGDKAGAEQALVHIGKVLELAPDDPVGLQLKASAERILNPTPNQARASSPLPVDSDDDVSGVSRRPGEKQADYDRRVEELEGRVAEARAALGRQEFSAAIAALHSVLESESGHVAAQEELARAHQQRLDAAKAEFARAEAEVEAGTLLEAVASFSKAEAIDPSVAVAARVAAVRARMAKEGQRAFLDGYNFSISGRTDQAIPLLRKAYAYLPERDPDKAKARAELERLKVSLR